MLFSYLSKSSTCHWSKPATLKMFDCVWHLKKKTIQPNNQTFVQIIIIHVSSLVLLTAQLLCCC